MFSFPKDKWIMEKAEFRLLDELPTPQRRLVLAELIECLRDIMCLDLLEAEAEPPVDSFPGLLFGLDAEIPLHEL